MSAAECDGGQCGVGGYCDECSASELTPRTCLVTGAECACAESEKCTTGEPAEREAQLHREHLGRIVRQEWMRWAREQPNPKPSWLQSWECLTEPEREVDRRIGEALLSHVRMVDAATWPETQKIGDERIFALAKEHFGGSGHGLIWEDDPRYAAAFELPKTARWSQSVVTAEETLAFARALLAEVGRRG